MNAHNDIETRLVGIDWTIVEEDQSMLTSLAPVRKASAGLKWASQLSNNETQTQ
jgi:hypothetical protein